MTKFRISVLCAAMLTVLFLAGCGDTVQESSAPEGIETFGTAVNPSIQPSTGQTTPSASGGPSVNVPAPSGNIGESNAQPASTPSPSRQPVSEPAEATASHSTPTPSPSPSASPEPSSALPPVVEPPAPATTADSSQAAAFVGRPLSDLFDELGGYSNSSDYELIDEEDPDAGEIGTHYFNGFTVITKRTADSEIITAVIEG